MTLPRRPRALETTALALLAATYFHGGIRATLEWMDEGMIVYPSWRVAEGDLPYVHFQHVYGPSLFFVNGLLLRLFGPDLNVLRLFLVGLKAMVAVLVYEASRRVAPRWIALLAWTVLVGVWGAPIWLFNEPYAAYYTTALALAGLLACLHDPPRVLRAGLLFGAAATFKQTQGLFAFLSLVLFIVCCTRSGPASGIRARGALLAGALRLLALAATLVLAVLYARAHLASGTVLLVLAPLAIAVGVLACRELAAWPPAPDAIAGVRSLLWATLGMAVPLAGYAAFYARHGALGELRYNTVSGLPQLITWFVPLRPPVLRTVALAAMILSSFAAVAAWRRHRTTRGVFLALAAIGASAAAMLHDAASTFGVRGYLQQWWPKEFYLLLEWLPPILVAAGATVLWRRTDDDPDRPALQLLCFFVAGALLQLYPAADMPHALMLLPVVLPLLAHLLARFHAAPAATPATRAAATLVVAFWPLVALAPFLETRFNVSNSAPAGRFARAAGIGSAQPHLEAEADLVRYLSETARPDRGLLLLTDQQMLYFLAGVRSALQEEEFVLYLTGAGFLSDEDARRVAGEERMIRALERARPLVVDDPHAPSVARFRSAFPRVAHFIDERYAPATAFGSYRVLAPRD